MSGAPYANKNEYTEGTRKDDLDAQPQGGNDGAFQSDASADTTNQGYSLPQREKDYVDESNIVDGPRSTRGDPTAADKKIDSQVDDATAADPGMN